MLFKKKEKIKDKFDIACEVIFKLIADGATPVLAVYIALEVLKTYYPHDYDLIIYSKYLNGVFGAYIAAWFVTLYAKKIKDETKKRERSVAV